MRAGSPRRPIATFILLVVAASCVLNANTALGQGKNSEVPKIRTITAFVRVDREHFRSQVTEAVTMLNHAREMFIARGYEVQTIRISTQPFGEYIRSVDAQDAIAFFREYDALAIADGFSSSIGPALIREDDNPSEIKLLGDILRATKNLNGSVVVAGEDGVHWKAVSAAAQLMKFLAANTERSRGNFRFSAIALVPPLTPFYPGSYHSGQGHQFAIGLQSANVVESSFRGARDRESASRNLREALGLQAATIEALARNVGRETGWTYVGMDVSPAPLGEVSIGEAIESLAKTAVGTSGTLTAASLITQALKAIPVQQAGYSGLMLPVLEDERLAQRWGQGTLSLDALLSYSAVCGTGLDVVPLPGEVTEADLTRIIGDVASLAVKWHKPLSARLLPVAGKKAGDHTDFADPLLVDTVIRPLVSADAQH